MEIQTANLLNILLPKDNKIIREALQQADLEQLSNFSKSTSIKDILTNLFADISGGTKSNETILNILKNSNLFIELKNFPKEIQTLQNLLSNEPTFSKLQQKIESFMINISNINESNLKTQIDNSGVFLESKIASSFKTIPNNLVNALNELKSILTNILQDNTKNYQPTQAQLNNNTSTNIDNANKVMNTLLNLSNSTNHTAIQNSIKLIENILNYNNSISPNTNQIANDIKSLLTNISSFINQNSISPQQNPNILKSVNEIENLFNKELANSLNRPQNHDRLNNVFESRIQNDIKAILLQLQKEIVDTNLSNKENQQEMLKSIDRLLSQIDYHQLLSITSNSNSLYLPFLWDLLEDGTIAVGKDSKEKFYCQINLKLKEDGKIDLLVALENNNIEITMHIQQEKFKKQIQENIQALKQSLNSVGLTPIGIQIYDLKEDIEQTNIKEEESKFFNDEIKEINLGLDIRV